MTTFDAWLRQLAAAGRRVPDAKCPQIVRGLAFVYRFTLAGNWAGATIASSLRLDPDAPGATVADFTPANLGYNAGLGVTTFTLSLTAAQTGALIADDDGDALVPLAWDVLFKPSGGTQERAFGGVATINGKVTNGG